MSPGGWLGVVVGLPGSAGVGGPEIKGKASTLSSVGPNGANVVELALVRSDVTVEVVTDGAVKTTDVTLVLGSSCEDSGVNIVEVEPARKTFVGDRNMESLGLFDVGGSVAVGEDVLVGRNVTVRFDLSETETGVTVDGIAEVEKVLDVNRELEMLLGTFDGFIHL